MCFTMAFESTFEYRALEAGSIRLLKVSSSDGLLESSSMNQLVHIELPNVRGSGMVFETVSYTWGDPVRVSNLPISGDDGEIIGHIALTANLTEALPRLTSYSTTKLLWIDQLCINQSDSEERGVQVGMMDRIYKASVTTLIWLGPGDEDSRLAKEWLDTTEMLAQQSGDRARVDPQSPTYHADTRSNWLSKLFSRPDADAMLLPAIYRFLHRPWFSRGWVVQELLLSDDAAFLAGDIALHLQNMQDLVGLPFDAIPKAIKADLDSQIPNNRQGCYHILVHLKIFPLTDEQPLQFLRFLERTAAQFITWKRRDRLYAFLGMLPGLCPDYFVPDQNCPLDEAFTRFILAMARKYGSLDFLSLCSTWQDNFLHYKDPEVQQELAAFPTWVPSWTATPFRAPFRLATGGVRVVRGDVAWNAAAGRKHVHDETHVDTSEKSPRTLRVRGKIVDRVHSISGARFLPDRYWDADDAYLEEQVAKIRNELPGQLGSWSITDMVEFLNIVTWSGAAPGADPGYKEARMILTRAKDGRDHLGLALGMTAGRRFMKSAKSRTGLVPSLGTTAMSSGQNQGSVIAVLHGCSVPVVLEPQPSGEGEVVVYKLVGDCHVEGIMLGDAVDWAENDADEFVLV